MTLEMLYYIYNRKEETGLQFIKISFIIILIIYTVILLYLSYKNGKTVKTLLLFSLSGMLTFTVINLLSGLTGIGINVNVWTLSSSAVFGIPGVLGLLVLRMFF